MSAERQPIIEETLEEEPEPQPFTESAGGVRPPGRVGGGIEDQGGGGGEPPDDTPPERRPNDEPPEWRHALWHHLPIEDLNLSMRTYNCLRRSRLLTVGAVLRTSEDALLALRNFGRKCYDELRDRLDEMHIVPADTNWPGGVGDSIVTAATRTEEDAIAPIGRRFVVAEEPFTPPDESGPDEGLHYCPRCGAPLIVRLLPAEDRPRLVCDRGHILYVNPKLVVGVIPERRGKILLMRRAIEPRIGFWTFPGGFIEIDESVEEAAAREAHEETGVNVRIDDVVGVYSRPAIGIVSIVFHGRVTGGKVDPGREALEARWFDPEDIPWDELAYDTTRWALRDWVRHRKKEVGRRKEEGGRRKKG